MKEVRITEGMVHIAVRSELKRRGWSLVAGQFPGGSDDECQALNVMDPTLARDGSPEPRRYSSNKMVPDLVALRARYLLLVEMKSLFNAGDLSKLRVLLSERRGDLILALESFAHGHDFPGLLPVATLNMVPALAFSRRSRFGRERDVCYFLVSSLEHVEILSPLAICQEGESLEEFIDGRGP